MFRGETVDQEKMEGKTRQWRQMMENSRATSCSSTEPPPRTWGRSSGLLYSQSGQSFVLLKQQLWDLAEAVLVESAGRETNTESLQ